jgi:hypothetical protein
MAQEISSRLRKYPHGRKNPHGMENFLLVHWHYFYPLTLKLHVVKNEVCIEYCVPVIVGGIFTFFYTCVFYISSVK